MIQPLLFGTFGLQEILIIALVVLLFFGGKKIPELMKGLGKGVRSFKEGMKEVDPTDEIKNDEAEEKKE
ncbi:MAG: twin-arginine translocase TatA/TatE family subunit [Bacteroidaceae bacterium]|nr:twin-arginine translocase TatA/TatE family subunit [Bacteroidaceae bacterium]